MEKKPTDYLRELSDRELERQVEHEQRLDKKQPKPAKGAWVDHPMSAKRRATPITGRVDPGTVDATRKRETQLFKLRSMDIRDVLKKLKEK